MPTSSKLPGCYPCRVNRRLCPMTKQDGERCSSCSVRGWRCEGYGVDVPGWTKNDAFISWVKVELMNKSATMPGANEMIPEPGPVAAATPVVPVGPSDPGSQVYDYPNGSGENLGAPSADPILAFPNLQAYSPRAGDTVDGQTSYGVHSRFNGMSLRQQAVDPSNPHYQQRPTLPHIENLTLHDLIRQVFAILYPSHQLTTDQIILAIHDLQQMGQDH